MARRPHILWSVNKLARANTKWTTPCDKRLARLLSHINFTSEYKQYLGLFQHSDFAGDLEVSKSTSGGTLCILGSRTFVPVSWRCKKQTCVSRSSTELEFISLNARLRMDGIPALNLWDLFLDVLHSKSNRKQQLKHERKDPTHCEASEMRVNSQCNRQISLKHLELSSCDQFTRGESKHFLFSLSGSSALKTALKPCRRGCKKLIAKKELSPNRNLSNFVSRSRAGISTVPSSTASSRPKRFRPESHDVCVYV